MDGSDGRKQSGPKPAVYTYCVVTDAGYWRLWELCMGRGTQSRSTQHVQLATRRARTTTIRAADVLPLRPTTVPVIDRVQRTSHSTMNRSFRGCRFSQPWQSVGSYRERTTSEERCQPGSNTTPARCCNRPSLVSS